MAISAAVRRSVAERADFRCEYCRMAESWEPFFSYHVEHITARQHGGSDEPENLAFACHHCNWLKGPNLSSLDPDTGFLTQLFNPRTRNWNDHFASVDGLITGLTAIGRTTIFLLRMNAPHRVELRLENADAV